MKPFREFHADALEPDVLQDEMQAHGYILIRNLLSTASLDALLKQILVLVSSAGWLQSGSDPSQRLADPSAACVDGDPAFKPVAHRVFCLESLHQMPHSSSLARVMRMLAGPELLIHPRSIPRLVFPNADNFRPMAHQDHQAIAGDAESFTAWMPLHDCPIELGPLQVVDASHRFGLQPTVANSIIPRDAALGDGWTGGAINAGDVLFFHSMTVHAATPNSSNRLRISLDCRFQDLGRPINPANIIFPGTGSKSWEDTYDGWLSSDLQYYWRRLPLAFRPSPAELVRLAVDDPSPEWRARYSRILTQMQRYYPELFDGETTRTTEPR
jgi:ectoine hydroxylase-related dioxygenase (phytanoyl-CoA dioxygenase family)